MATIDFSPLYRSSIGFDQLPGLLAQALKRDEAGLPPYNIEKMAEDQYRIVMTVAGFTKDDIEIVRDQSLLFVRGRLKGTEPKTYLYRGIAGGAFEREFDLAEYVEVTGASLDNGLLEISLKRDLPEALKPRHIPIGDGSSTEQTMAAPTQRAALEAA